MSTAGSQHAGRSAAVLVMLALRLLAELALIAAAAVAAAALTAGRLQSIALAFVAAVLVIGVWGAFIAPKARWRLADPWRLVVELVLFLSTAAGVAHTGYVVAAVVYGALAVGTAIAVRVWAAGS